MGTRVKLPFLDLVQGATFNDPAEIDLEIVALTSWRIGEDSRNYLLANLHEDFLCRNRVEPLCPIVSDSSNSLPHFMDERPEQCFVVSHPAGPNQMNESFRLQLAW